MPGVVTVRSSRASPRRGGPATAGSSSAGRGHAGRPLAVPGAHRRATHAAPLRGDGDDAYAIARGPSPQARPRPAERPHPPVYGPSSSDRTRDRRWCRPVRQAARVAGRVGARLAGSPVSVSTRRRIRCHPDGEPSDGDAHGRRVVTSKRPGRARSPTRPGSVRRAGQPGGEEVAVDGVPGPGRGDRARRRASRASRTRRWPRPSAGASLPAADGRHGVVVSAAGRLQASSGSSVLERLSCTRPKATSIRRAASVVMRAGHEAVGQVRRADSARPDRPGSRPAPRTDSLSPCSRSTAVASRSTARESGAVGIDAEDLHGGVGPSTPASATSPTSCSRRGTDRRTDTGEAAGGQGRGWTREGRGESTSPGSRSLRTTRCVTPIRARQLARPGSPRPSVEQRLDLVEGADVPRGRQRHGVTHRPRGGGVGLQRLVLRPAPEVRAERRAGDDQRATAARRAPSSQPGASQPVAGHRQERAPGGERRHAGPGRTIDAATTSAPRRPGDRPRARGVAGPAPARPAPRATAALQRRHRPPEPERERQPHPDVELVHVAQRRQRPVEQLAQDGRRDPVGPRAGDRHVRPPDSATQAERSDATRNRRCGHARAAHSPSNADHRQDGGAEHTRSVASPASSRPATRTAAGGRGRRSSR